MKTIKYSLFAITASAMLLFTTVSAQNATTGQPTQHNGTGTQSGSTPNTNPSNANDKLPQSTGTSSTGVTGNTGPHGTNARNGTTGASGAKGTSGSSGKKTHTTKNKPAPLPKRGDMGADIQTPGVRTN